jgi:hypothetical protein
MLVVPVVTVVITAHVAMIQEIHVSVRLATRFVFTKPASALIERQLDSPKITVESVLLDFQCAENTGSLNQILTRTNRWESYVEVESFCTMITLSASC